MESPYPSGVLRITPGIARPIAVRLPGWVATDDATAAVPGSTLEATGRWLTIDSPAPGETIYPGEWEKAKKLIAEGKDINY